MFELKNSTVTIFNDIIYTFYLPRAALRKYQINIIFLIFYCTLFYRDSSTLINLNPRGCFDAMLRPRYRYILSWLGEIVLKYLYIVSPHNIPR